MGTLINQVLGDPKGKIGNVIYTIRNHKVITYVMPSKIKISNSPKAKASRQKLVTQAKFQSFINNIPELHTIWESAEIDCHYAYLKIAKINSQYLDSYHPTIKNSIVPITNKDQVLDIDAKITSSGINLKVKIEHKNFVLRENEKEKTGTAVICFYQPKRKKADHFQLYKMTTGPVDWRMEKTLEISLPFDEEGKENYYLYSKSILYITFITKDSNQKVVRYSKNYSQEFSNKISNEEEKSIKTTHKKILKKGIKRKFKKLLRKVIVKALQYTEE